MYNYVLLIKPLAKPLFYMNQPGYLLAIGNNYHHPSNNGGQLHLGSVPPRFHCPQISLFNFYIFHNDT